MAGECSVMNVTVTQLKTVNSALRAVGSHCKMQGVLYKLAVLRATAERSHFAGNNL